MDNHDLLPDTSLFLPVHVAGALLSVSDFIAATKGISRDDAYMLCSATMDLMVTQVVDGTKGIHAMMPKAIFQK